MKKSDYPVWRTVLGFCPPGTKLREDLEEAVGEVRLSVTRRSDAELLARFVRLAEKFGWLTMVAAAVEQGEALLEVERLTKRCAELKRAHDEWKRAHKSQAQRLERIRGLVLRHVRNLQEIEPHDLLCILDDDNGRMPEETT